MFDQQAINETLRNFYQHNSAGTFRITTEKKMQDSVCIINISLQFISQKIKAPLRLGTLREKCPNTEFFLVRIFPCFPAFRLNTERYELSLRIRSKCGKIRTRKNSVFGHFSRNGSFNQYWNYHTHRSVILALHHRFAFQQRQS